jgi:hypothetical protein
LAQLGETLRQTPEQFKAWSQNLGHEGVLTTFNSYGTVAAVRQSEIMQDLAKPRRGNNRSLMAGHIIGSIDKTVRQSHSQLRNSHARLFLHPSLPMPGGSRRRATCFLKTPFAPFAIAIN